MTKPDEAAMHQVRDILQRCVVAIDNLAAMGRRADELAHVERQRLRLAEGARDEARLWLARWEKP